MVKVGGGRQLLSDDQFEIETKQMYSLKVTIVKHRIKLYILNTERVTGAGTLEMVRHPCVIPSVRKQ